MKKSKLYLLGFFTLFGMGGISIILIELFQDSSTMSLFETGMVWYYQLLIGLIYGLVAALLGWRLINIQLMHDVKSFYALIIQQLKLNWLDIIFISFCAAVGEELLFRGAIQYWLGIYITSIVFVGIHGYLNSKDWKIRLYGGYLTLVMIGVSYGFEELGMISAMTAHFAIDVYLLSVISIGNKRSHNTVENL